MVLDASGSVKFSNWKKEVDYAKQLINKFNVSENGAHIGVIDFSTQARIRVNLNGKDGKQIGKIHRILDFLKADYRGGFTYMMNALRKAYEMFKNIPRARNSRKLLVVITDGETEEQVQLLRISVNHLRSLSVTTYSVGVGKRVNHKGLLLLANNVKSNVLNVSSFDDLVGKVKTMKEVLCSSKLFDLLSTLLFASTDMIENNIQSLLKRRCLLHV